MFLKLLVLFIVINVGACSEFQPAADTQDPAGRLANLQKGKLETTLSSIKTVIMDQKCLPCHKSDGEAKKIPFETQEQILHGSIDDGPLVVPGHSADSPLFLVMSSDASLRGDLKSMPPEKAQTGGQISAVTLEEQQFVAAWIDGLPIPNSTPVPNQANGSE